MNDNKYEYYKDLISIESNKSNSFVISSLIINIINVMLLLITTILGINLYNLMVDVRLFIIIFFSVLSLVLMANIVVSSLMMFPFKNEGDKKLINVLKNIEKNNNKKRKILLVSSIILYSYLLLVILFGISLMILSICL